LNVANGDTQHAATNAALEKIDADAPDVDWGEVAQTAAAAAGTAACAAYGLGPAAPLCGVVAAELVGFVVDEVGPALADAWDSIFGSEPPEPILIGPLSPELKWAGYWARLQSDDATRIPLEHAIGAMLRAAARIAPGAWTTETMLGWLEECGGALHWRTGLSVDNRSFAGMESVCYRETPSAACEWVETPAFPTVAGRPTLSAAWWFPDWPKHFRSLHPFDNEWETLAAYVAEYVDPWWANLYGRALPCLSARLMADAIALQADRIAAQYRSAQLAELAALPPEDVAALQAWAELEALSPEDAEALRNWAALQALTETEREQLRALAAFGELPAAELARLQFVGELTRGRNFGRFGAALAAPLGASA